MKYNPEMLDKQATRLYRRSFFLIVSYGLAGLIIGYIVAAAMYSNQNVTAAVGQTSLEIRLAVITLGVIVGAAYGESKSFKLRLQAQIVLCLKQIEENTRRYS